MGARNVAKAFTYWVSLDDRSFRVLCRMALLSMDDGNPPKYFAGRDDLAEALGKHVPAKPEDGDLSPEADAARKQRASVYEIVRKAVARLAKEGVIVSSGDARFRNRAEYSLHLTPKVQTQQNVAPASNESLPLQTQQTIAPLAQRNVAPMPQQIVATDPTERCPLGVEEQLQEQLIGLQIGIKPEKAEGSPDGDGASPSESDADPIPDEPRSKAALEKQLGEDFNDWYTLYPKHSGRGAAVSAYRKARKSGATTEELLAGARRYSTERNGQDPRYTKMPATWLNQECWTDEPAQAPQGPWSQEYHRPNIPPQYAWANQPTSGSARRLQEGLARIGRNSSERRMIANLEALEGWAPGPLVDVFEQKALNQQPELPESHQREDKTA